MNPDDKDIIYVEEMMMVEALGGTLEPILMGLLAEGYKRLNADYNKLHSLLDDSFISTEEDLTKSLALKEEEAF